MSDLRFSKDHEWIRLDGETATVGITDYAQNALGDVVFVEPPEAGRELGRGDEAGVIESVKAASEIYAPVGGTVIAGNEALAENPALVNTDPLGEGWVFTLTLSDPAELNGLMDEAAYQSYVEGLA